MPSSDKRCSTLIAALPLSCNSTVAGSGGVGQRGSDGSGAQPANLAVLLGQDIDLAQLVLPEPQVHAIADAGDGHQRRHDTFVQQRQLLELGLSAQLQIGRRHVEDPPDDHVAKYILPDECGNCAAAIDGSARDRSQPRRVALIMIVLREWVGIAVDDVVRRQGMDDLLVRPIGDEGPLPCSQP